MAINIHVVLSLNHFMNNIVIYVKYFPKLRL